MRGARFAQTGTTTTAATTLYYVSDNASIVNNSYILFGIDINGGTTGFGQAGTYLSTGRNGTGTLRPLILHNYDSQPIIFATANTERARIFGTGNFGIGTGSSDTGERLQVTGDVFIKGSGATSGTRALLIQNSAGTQLMRLYNNYQSGAYIGAEFGDGTFAGTNFFNNLNGTASIQTRFVEVNASDAILNINGGNGVGNTSLTQNRGSVLLGNQNYALTGSTQNNVVVCVTGSFIPTSGSAGFVDLFVRPTINQTGGANGITRGLYVNPTLTSAADFRAIETARGNVVFGNLPTSSAGLPTGAIWNDAGTIKIV
jgi:hypothetical protein